MKRNGEARTYSAPTICQELTKGVTQVISFDLICIAAPQSRWSSSQIIDEDLALRLSTAVNLPAWGCV